MDVTAKFFGGPINGEVMALPAPAPVFYVQRPRTPESPLRIAANQGTYRLAFQWDERTAAYLWEGWDGA